VKRWSTLGQEMDAEEERDFKKELEEAKDRKTLLKSRNEYKQ